jgi:hypothetical protein
MHMITIDPAQPVAFNGPTWADRAKTRVAIRFKFQTTNPKVPLSFLMFFGQNEWATKNADDRRLLAHMHFEKAVCSLNDTTKAQVLKTIRQHLNSTDWYAAPAPLTELSAEPAR